ncbi:MAG: transglycosylase domain-containing protein, partial [Acidiferrobacter sp.]
FGPGLYGVAAASQYYFGKPVSTLDTREAAELAATLPDPLGSNPATRSWYFRARTAKILRLLHATWHRSGQYPKAAPPPPHSSPAPSGPQVSRTSAGWTLTTGGKTP